MKNKMKTTQRMLTILPLTTLVAALVLTASDVKASHESSSSHHEGNRKFQSFAKAKRVLQTEVYSQLPKKTVYCGASYNDSGVITDANGFSSTKYKKRGKKVEWEHVVPAELFGRSFSSWRYGDPACVTGKGKPYKGRRCAYKVSRVYRYMAADLYNLYPAIGAVNAMRSNYPYAAITGEGMGECNMIINGGKANPPDRAKGAVARVSLYYAETYSRFKLSAAKKRLFEAWDKQFPVTETECDRNKIIEKLQGNINQILTTRCED